MQQFHAVSGPQDLSVPVCSPRTVSNGSSLISALRFELEWSSFGPVQNHRKYLILGTYFN